MAEDLSDFARRCGPAILVEVAAVKGSTPREAGAWMLVGADSLHGTIGGGAFEYMAIDHARALLSGRATAGRQDIPLGPAIGQCCGGFVTLTYSAFDANCQAQLAAKLRLQAETRPDVRIFGAGHVGKALAHALAPLPLAVTVIETRAGELTGLPDGVATCLTPLPEAEVARLAPGGAVVILTHDHALDFLIARQALARNDLAYIGMIGSATKRATFSRWFAAEKGDPAALERLTLPIGGTALRDKRPEVIAALVAAEVLTHTLTNTPRTGTVTSRTAVTGQTKGELNV